MRTRIISAARRTRPLLFQLSPPPLRPRPKSKQRTPISGAPETICHQSLATLDDSRSLVWSYGRYRSRCALQLNGTTQVPHCALSRSLHRLFSSAQARLRVPLGLQTPVLELLPASEYTHAVWVENRNTTAKFALIGRDVLQTRYRCVKNCPTWT